MSVSLFTAFAVAGSINGSSAGWARFAEAGAGLLASPVLVEKTFLGLEGFVGTVVRAGSDGLEAVSGSSAISRATAASAIASTDSSGSANGAVTGPGAGDANDRDDEDLYDEDLDGVDEPDDLALASTEASVGAGVFLSSLMPTIDLARSVVE